MLTATFAPMANRPNRRRQRYLSFPSPKIRNPPNKQPDFLLGSNNIPDFITFLRKNLTTRTAHEDHHFESNNSEENRASGHPRCPINPDFISPQLPSASNLSYSAAGSSSLTASPTQNTETTDPAKWKRIPSDRSLKVEWILEG